MTNDVLPALVSADTSGNLTTTSLVIADGTGTQHKNVLELIRNNLSDFEEFGRVAFQTRPFVTAGGSQKRDVAILTEEHATLLMTYMRNSDIVRDFKKRLVRAFFELRRATIAPAPAAALEGPELLARAVLEAADTIKRIDTERLQLVAKVEHDAPMLAKAEAHTASTKAIHRQEFAREVQAWGQKIHGIKILHKHVYAFLAHKGMTVGGQRSDTGHATAHAVSAGWAWTDKGVSEDGHEYATTRLNPRGQDVAWKWITKHVDEHGTLELPRAINGGDAA